jgi:POT family proton-dependent oligopeptide transporter
MGCEPYWLYMTTETMGDSRGPGLGWSSQEALYGCYDVEYM